MANERKFYAPFTSFPLLFCAVAALLVLTSCATTPRGEVYRDWSTSFSELGIYPIFPPREDVMVGDIYLLPMHPLNSYVIGNMGGLGMTGIHIGYGDWLGPNGGVSLATNLENYYLNRPTFPDGPVGAQITSPTNATPTTNTADAGTPGKKPPEAKDQAAAASPAADKASGTNQPPMAAAPNSDGAGTNASAAVASKPVDAAAAKTNSAPVTPSPATDVAKSDTNAPAKTNQTVSANVPILPKSPPDLRTNIFAPLEPVRLKEVAFPEFSFTTIHEASAAASVPIEGVLVNAGMDVSKVTQISVKIPVAESYGMPAGRLLRDFCVNDLWHDGTNWYVRATPSANEFNVISTPAGEMARAMFTKTLDTVIANNFPAWKHPFKSHRLRSSVDADRSWLYLALVTEVFYTRAIDITVTGTSAFTGGASAAPVSPANVAQWMSLNKGSTNSTSKGSTNSSAATTNSQTSGATNSASVSETITSTSGAAENSDPFAVAAKLRDLPLGSTNGIGGSVRVLGVTAHNIALQRTFEHPIAVGVRGVLMKISANAEPLPGSIKPFMEIPATPPTDIPTMGYKIDLTGQ